MVVDGDGSTTESEEFFDEVEGDDDHNVEGGGDPLGGVSVQSSPLPTVGAGGGADSASHLTAATTGTGVKQELLAPTKRLSEPEATATATTMPSRNVPTSIHVASLFGPSTAAGARAAALSSASGRPGVSTAVKHESHMTSAHQAAPPPHVPHAYGISSNTNNLQRAVPASRPSPPVVQTSAASTMVSSHASANSTQWPPPPPATYAPSVLLGRGPPSSDYRAPVAFQASRPGEYAPSYGGSAGYMGAYSASYGGAAPFRPHAPTPGPSPTQTMDGYQPPPRVDYAPPRTLQSQYQSLPVHEAAASSVRPSSNPTITSSATAPAPSTYSVPLLAGAAVQFGGRAPTQCRHCFAKLDVPLLKIGRDCRCCGMIYPFSQFPMQNNQDKNPQRHCHACYAARIKKNTVARSTHPAVLRSQRSTEHISLPPAPVHAVDTNGSAPRFTPIRPPPRIPPLLATQSQQPTIPGPTQAFAAQSLPLAAPVSASAPAPAAAMGRRCASCNLVVYNVQPSRNASANLKCACCLQILLKNKCFSKSQRKEGKHRCKACLGHVNRGSSSEPPPAKEPSQVTQQKVHKPVLRSEIMALSAERQVTKYHLARRSLQRRREANDLHGSTRVEYEKQLAKEDADLKALETQLRAKFPQLFDKQVGIQVVAPSIPRGERDRPDTTAKKKKIGKPSEKSELRAKKKKEQETAARLNAAAAAVANSTIRRSTPEVFDLTSEPSPGTIALANLSVKLPKPEAAAKPARVKATKPAAPAVTTKPAAKPTVAVKAKAAVKPTTISATTAARKRKEAATSTSIQVAAKEKQPTKKSKTTKTSATTAANDGHDEDPWLAAHDEIAQGLSQLLGGNLDDVLGIAVEKEEKPQVKSEPASPPPSSVLSVKKEKNMKSEAQRSDPSTYIPKPKLQAGTPPRTAIVTRARKRSVQPPPAIIDMTDSPKSASPKEMKKMRFFI